MVDDDDDDDVSYWRVGDIARCYSQSLGVVDVEVTAGNVDELNDDRRHQHGRLTDRQEKQ